MTTIVEQLGAYAAALRYEDLPREVVQQAVLQRPGHHRRNCSRLWDQGQDKEGA